MDELSNVKIDDTIDRLHPLVPPPPLFCLFGLASTVIVISSSSPSCHHHHQDSELLINVFAKELTKHDKQVTFAAAAVNES